MDNRVCVLCFLIVNKKLTFFSDSNVGTKSWFTIICVIIVVLLVAVVVIIVVVVIVNVITIPTTSGTVLCGKKRVHR